MFGGGSKAASWRKSACYTFLDLAGKARQRSQK